MDKLTSSSVLVVLVVIVAIYYKKSNDAELQNHLQSTLSSLLRAEKKVQLDGTTRVAVGFGACQDIYADAMKVLDGIKASPPDDPEHVSEINTLEDLEKIYGYFFNHGAAAERYISNSSLFEGLVKVARSLPESRYPLGGNAPVMANRFVHEGCNVMLGASVTDQLRRELHPDIKVVGGDLEFDDIHLILEYKKGQTWGRYVSPRANRFIAHNDDNNPHIESLERFRDEVQIFKPSLLAIGGLQMMDKFPFREGERAARLSQLKDLLLNVPDSTLVHFEMASFAEEACFRDVIENVMYHVDSLGMNEQELPNLYGMLTSGNMTLVSDAHPRIATTLDHMRQVYHSLRKTQGKMGYRKLTRIHVHTLAYQAIMTTKGSAWKNTMSAAAKASLTAHRHVCGSDYIHTEKATLLMDDSFTTSREGGTRVPFQSEKPVSCWEESDFLICIAPVLVCTEVVQTGGGGDNISSAGLVLQV